jgi:DNA-binding MarR family transcriptional regulator
VVEGLQAAGLVRREADPADRRSVLVSLTEAGRGRLDELAAARRQAAEELFGRLGAADQRRLLGLLTTLDDRTDPPPDRTAQPAP